MSRFASCRRSGAPIAPDRFAAVRRLGGLGPRCRGTMPPTGEAPTTDRGATWPCPPEATP